MRFILHIDILKKNPQIGGFSTNDLLSHSTEKAVTGRGSTVCPFLCVNTEKVG